MSNYPDKTLDDLTDEILDQIVEGKFVVTEIIEYGDESDIYAFSGNRKDDGETLTPVNQIDEVRATVSGIYQLLTADTDYELYDDDSDGAYDSIRFLGVNNPDDGTSFKVTYRHTDSAKASGITDRNVGSVNRTLAEAVASRLEDVYDLLLYNYQSAFLDTAQGDSLDALVKLVGIARVEASKATGKLMFYTDENVTSDLTIPIGTTVQTTGGVQFQTIEVGVIYTGYNYTCDSGGTEQGVLSEAVTAGDEGNVGSGTITVFVGTPPSPLLTAVNNPSIINGIQNLFSGGADDETDETLRTRAGSAIITAGRGTKDAIRGALLAISGVAEATVHDFVDDSAIPLGETHITVLGTTVPLDESGSTWQTVLSTVDDYRSAGVRPVVKQPWQRFIYLEGTSMTLKGSDYDKDVVATSVGDALASYLDGFEIGDDLLWNGIINAAMQVAGCRDFDIDELDVSDQTVTVGGSGSDYQIGTSSSGRIAQSFVPGFRSVIEEVTWVNTGDANPDYVVVSDCGSDPLKSATGIFLLGDEGERSSVDPVNYSDGTFHQTNKYLYVDTDYDDTYPTGTDMRAEYLFYHVKTIRGVRITLKKDGSYDGTTVTVRIETDSSGPSGTLADVSPSSSGTIAASALQTTYTEHYVEFAGDCDLTAGDKYWIVIYSDHTTGYLYAKASTSAGTYGDGEPKRSTDAGSTWVDDMQPGVDGTQNYDMAFKTIQRFTDDVRIDAGVKPPQIVVRGSVTVTGSEVEED